MRHAVKGSKLNRDTANRRALFKNLTLALIEYGKINTTAAKAKAIRASVEKLITKAKTGTLHNRRQIDQVLNRRSAVNKLVDEIAPAIMRASGYTRTTKLGNRRGDDAEMVRLEILDWKPKTPVAEVKKEVKTEKAAGKPSKTKATKEAVSVSKVKQPATSGSQAKRIPQKRISGGK